MTPQLGLREEVFDDIQTAQSVEESVYILRDRYSLSDVTYHMMQTVSLNQGLDTPYVKTTYPNEWVARYLLKDYIKVDPVVKTGFLRVLPFDWTEISPTKDAMVMLQDYHAHKLGGNGFSIPITDKRNRRALLSLNSTMDQNMWEKTTLEYLQDWTELGQILHQKAIIELYGKADPAPSLSKRQLETLNLSAAGLDHRQIAKELGISEHTVRNYQQSLRHKLGASSLTQAVAIASQLKIINSN